MSSSTDTETGNNISGTHTSVASSTDDATATTAGGDGTTEYARTAISTDGSGTTNTWSDDSDLSTQTMTDASSSTVDESGNNATTAYSFAEVDGSTTTQVETDDSLSGISTTTQTANSTSSLHETGSETGSGAYTLDHTTNGYMDTTQVDDAETGDYTLSGTEGTSSTAIESNTHGSYSALYTEILTDDSTIGEEGSDLSGQYVLSQTGAQSDNYVDAGTDASGSYDVTEGSTGSYAQTTDGDNSTGITVIQTTTTTGYSMTEVVSGSENYTLTEHGTDTPTGTQTVNTVTGDYSIVENGTDLYTLSETGTLSGAFTDTVVGTDGYSSTETGNTIQQTGSETTTGGGSWTRTDTGGTLSSGSGTNAYTLVASGDQNAGSFTQSETGTDRYGLVESFDDVSNTGSGSTPGNVTFYSHGMAFQDPPNNEGNERNECNAPPAPNPGTAVVSGVDLESGITELSNSKANVGKKLATIREGKDNVVLELWCLEVDGAPAIVGRMPNGGKPIAFGQCRADAGINIFTTEKDKAGKITKIAWVNIGAGKVGQQGKPAPAGQADALNIELTKEFEKQSQGAKSIDDLNQAWLKTFASQDGQKKDFRDRLQTVHLGDPLEEKKPNDGKFITYQTVLYVMTVTKDGPQIEVFRLNESTTRTMRWGETKLTPKGVNLKVFDGK